MQELDRAVRHGLGGAGRATGTIADPFGIRLIPENGRVKECVSYRICVKNEFRDFFTAGIAQKYFLCYTVIALQRNSNDNVGYIGIGVSLFPHSIVTDSGVVEQTTGMQKYAGVPYRGAFLRCKGLLC